MAVEEMASISIESFFSTPLYHPATSNCHHWLGGIHRTINTHKFETTDIVTTQRCCSSKIGGTQQFLEMDRNEHNSKWRGKKSVPKCIGFNDTDTMDDTRTQEENILFFCRKPRTIYVIIKCTIVSIR